MCGGLSGERMSELNDKQLMDDKARVAEGLREKEEPRAKGRRRRKVSYLTINKIATVDYKDVSTLRRFINDRGKILPSRQSGNTAKQQRMIARAIRRAREMALLPFVVRDQTDRGGNPRRERGYQQYTQQNANANAARTEEVATEMAHDVHDVPEAVEQFEAAND